MKPDSLICAESLPEGPDVPQPRNAVKGLRSKRQPRASRLHGSGRRTGPLEPVDHNGFQPPGPGRENRKEPVFTGSLEDYVDYMTSVGRAETPSNAPPPGPNRDNYRTIRAAARRRDAALAKLPPAERNRATIEGLQARPCKTLYRAVGLSSFELLISRMNGVETYAKVADAPIRLLIDFAKASNIKYAGIGEGRLAYNIQEALEYQVLRDVGVLEGLESCEHLR